MQHALLTRLLSTTSAAAASAGAIADAEAVLTLQPGNADALYVRALAMHSRQSKSTVQRRSGSGSAAAAYKASEIEAALRAFLASAPPEHNKRPHGFYTLAVHLLHSKGAAGAAAMVSECESAYAAGLAAEADQPPFFLPVECGMKDLVPPMIRMLRAMPSRSAAGAAAAAKKGSSGAGSSSSGGSSKGGCCDRCGAVTEKLMRCSRCQQRRFCSKECQVADWKEGHSRVCGKQAAAGK
jgi:hypothetical protein